MEFVLNGNVLEKCNSNDEEIIIPDGITKISDYAFKGCHNLISITLPKSIKNIGHDAFDGCNKLKNIYVSSFSHWCSINFDEQFRYFLLNGPKIIIDGKELKLESDIIIPEGTKRIGNYAFHGYENITSITLPNSIESVGNGAFMMCEKLKKINLPNSIKRIGFDAFSDCKSLNSIAIPNSIKRIKKSTFQNCVSLTNIEIPGNVETIEWAAFMFCTGIKTITILDGVTNIHNSSFGSCDEIDSVTLPNSIKVIGSSAFMDSNIKELHINDLAAFFSIDYKSNVLVRNRRYEKLFVKGKEFQIEPDLIIPEGVTKIGKQAFFSNRNLISVTLPNAIESIGKDAFLNCKNLKSFNFSSKLKSIDNIELTGSPIEKLATVQAFVENYISYFYFNSDEDIPKYPKCSLTDVTITEEEKKKYLPILLEKCKKDPKYYVTYATFADDDTVKELLDKLPNKSKKDKKTILRIKGAVM